MLFICYKNCSNCKAIEKTLVEKNVSYEKRDIKEDNPTPAELQDWHNKSGLEIIKFFNTSGISYRELGLKDKLPEMTIEEKYEILGTDGMLVRRPIIITEDDEVYVGPLAKEFVELL